MNAPKTIQNTGELVGPFLRAFSIRLHERLAAWFPRPLQAGTTAPHFAVERPQSPATGGRRSRGSLAWLRALSGLPADAGRVLRTALPGLLALLVAAGWAAGAQAQTAPTVPSVSPTEIYEGETLEFTLFVDEPFGLNYAQSRAYGRVTPDGGSTATEGASNDWYLADSDGNRLTELGDSGNPISDSIRVGDDVHREIDFRLHARTDNLTEGDETIRLYGYSYSSPDLYVTITLKDGPRPVTSTDGVTLSESTLTLTELGSSSDAEKTYTVVLDTDPGADVTFTATVPAANSSEVEIKTGSAAFGSSATLTFTHGNTGNWSSAQTVTVRALNDANATNTTSFNLTHSLTVASGPYASITPDPVAVSVTDAGHGVTVSKARVSVAENSDTETYTIQLKSQPGGSVVITPTSSATARATVSGALTFTNSNWSTPQTVTVTGAGAGSATISHMVTTGTTDYPTSTTIASVTATVAAVPELTFASATYAVTEDDHPNIVTATVTVNASVAPTSDLTVNLSSAAVTATVNDDYSPPASTFTFTSGTTMKTIDVNIRFDDFYEVAETFTLTLTGGTGYTVGTPATTTVTINNDDNVGMRLDAATDTVGEGDGNYTVTVHIVGESEAPIDVTLTMDDGTATGGSGGTGAGIDYNSDTLTPVRLPGHDDTVTRTIRINDDNIFEGDETFTITVSIVDGQSRVVVASPSVTTVTITDNDTAPPTVTMSASDGDSDGNAVEGATDSTGYRTITLTLGRALTGAETMTVPLTVVGATVTDDYTFGLEPGTQTGVALTTSGGTYTAQNPAVVFSSGGQTATLRLTPVDNDDRTQPYVVVDVGTPISNRGTVSAPTGDPIGIVLVDDETGDIEVPSSWGLAPLGLSGGDDFRLLFRTSDGRNATSSDIAAYDAFVRGVLAKTGHADIKPYAGFFKVFGSTMNALDTDAGGTTARVHNGLASVHTGHHDGNSDVWTDGSTRATVGNAAGVPTYWLNGAILANNYADLCDVAWSSGNGVTTGWDTDDPRSEDGTPNIPSGSISDYGPYSTWTGTGNACEAYNHPLGFTTVSRSSADSGGGQSLLHQGSATNTGIHPFYGYSPVFKIEDDTPSEVTVAADWALIPSGISAGEKFRLLFVTSTTRDASATDIATYNTFVQNRAAAGHTAIRSHSAEFRVVASTSSVDARDNSATTGTGVPIYWLGGSNSNRVADNYADFYDGNWDSYVNTNENGADTGNGSGAGNATVWTGSNDNGTRHSSNPLGATNVQYGQLFFASTNAPFNRAQSGNSNSRHLYGLSPVYTVQAAVVVPELTFGSATYSGAEDGGTIDVTVNADAAPSSALTVNLTTANGTATGGTDFTAPGTTFTFPAGTTSHTISVPITDDSFLERDETFTLTLGARTGYTVGTRASTTVTITDQDTVTIELEQSSITVLENGALNVAVAITSSPNSAETPVTFTLTPTDGTATGNSSGTGAGIDYDNDARMVPIPTGVASTSIMITINDDADQEVDETFTLALSTTQARVSVGTRSSATVTIADNDRARGLVFTPASVTVDEGASATYTVRPTAAPTNEVTVSVIVPGSTDLSIDTLPNSPGTSTQALTFTTSNWYIGQPIELTAAEDVDSANDSVSLTHSPTGGGYGGTHNANLMVTIEDNDMSATAPVISVALPISEGESRTDAGEKKVDEGDGGVGIGFPLSANQSLPSALTVCVRVTESGGDRVASGDEGIKTVSLTSSGMTNGSGTHTLTWTNTAADDRDSSVTVEVVAPNTASCSATNGSYTVSSSDASDKLLIQDDENTTVELTASDPTMTEGDASDTAVLTVALSRRLYAGETIGVPIALASATGARLPGSVDGGSAANHDFAVGAAAGSGHSGVTLAADAPAATPRLVFTGHDSNTVQTATVTLTPVANRDDPDATHETITATLTSLGLLDTTVSGVAAHASNNAATLTLEDDEAPPAACSAQDNSLSVSSVRVLENGGMATYCVRLPTAPSGGNTTVTIGKTGRYPGAANASTTTLTFTASNYMNPQPVTVTGVDQPNLHLNRTLSLTHSANGGGYSNQGLGSVQVAVDDAPELEAFWHIQGNARIQRPHTVTSTPGLTPWQNAAPGYELAYVLRLSNRPEPGGTVTVTATVPSDKRNLVGLSLTGPSVPLDGPAYHNWATNLPGTVDVEFKDRSPGAGTGCSNWLGLEDHEYIDSRGYRRTVSGGGPSESYDGTADTPWECWRMIYVVRKPASRNIDDTCADITHTATGGGVRKVTVDTVRAHVRNPSRNRRGSRGYNSQCRNLTGNTLPPQGSPAQAAPAPTDPVTNLQVTAVDDANASVSWDAVEHATWYDVSWSAESSDSLNASAGSLPGVTGTSTTIRHDASEPMTLTVTVTPEYVDENGDTQQLDSLAGTATLEVGPRPLDGGGGTDGGGDGGPIQAGEGEAPGAAFFALPVAHWRLDGDALDWAGSSHGTVGGGAVFATNEDGSGVGSHALVLDGSDDHVDLASHASNFPLGDAARSVTGWFRADAGNQRQTFFTYGPNVAGQRFSIAADRTQALVAVSGHAWGVNGLSLDDGWHHVAVTYAGGDSDSISIYLDGALQSASTLVGAPQSVDTQPGSPGSSPAAIGRNVSGDAHYAGSIDDVRIYDVALGAEQVLALFNEHPQTPPSPPPVTTAVAATATPALAESNLDGASVELSLDAGEFAATVATSDVTASGVTGVSVSSLTRDSDTQATATLAFDGTDFDADATLTLTVSATALAHSDTDLSATLPVTAVDEPPPPPPPPPAVSIPAPVAHWKFDGDADDSAGSSNGAARNGASFTTTASVGSHALSLDGSDDYVDLASHASSFPLGNSARSVTGWFRADAGSQRQTFFTYGPNVEGKRLSIAADRTQAVVAVSGHAWGVNNLSLADGWHHIAVTFAGGQSDDFSIYLDGVKQSASTLGGARQTVDTRSGTAAIGRNVGGNAHYGGDIDDVRVYGYALSAQQVQAIAGRQETASVQDSAQATAAMPGGLVLAPLALLRASGGADGTGAGAFATDGFGASLATASSTGVHAPLVPGSSNPLREGLVRIVNPSAQAGEVQIVAIDDAGRRSMPVTLDIGAGAAAQFTSRDLEWGNAALGLSGSTGPGTGDWRLEVSSGLDVEVLPYVRTTDGTLSAMADVAPVADNVHRVALFNPANSPDAASKLRLTNRGAQALRASITGIDDTGASPGSTVSVEIAADESVLLTAAELESGGAGLLGALGDGEGQWRLDIASDGDLAVMNLVETSDGRLTNLSNATATTVPARKAHVVDRFPSSSDLSNEQGVVRIVNSTESQASIRIEPHDSTGWGRAPLTLTLGAGEAANLGAWDLELGNAAKGLSGNAGPGAGGAWRLEISSDSDIEVLTYARAPNGLLKVPPAAPRTVRPTSPTGWCAANAGAARSAGARC